MLRLPMRQTLQYNGSTLSSRKRDISIDYESNHQWINKAQMLFMILLNLHYSSSQTSPDVTYPNVWEPKNVKYGGTSEERGRNISFLSSQYDWSTLMWRLWCDISQQITLEHRIRIWKWFNGVCGLCDWYCSMLKVSRAGEANTEQ